MINISISSLYARVTSQTNEVADKIGEFLYRHGEKYT